MAKMKLTGSERLVDEQMLAMLEWASGRPDKWRKSGKLNAMKKTAGILGRSPV
jgi:hypothetical protein